ncbi:3219_t:CDS:2, partial [Gigaspora rosea]
FANGCPGFGDIINIGLKDKICRNTCRQFEAIALRCYFGPLKFGRWSPIFMRLSVCCSANSNDRYRTSIWYLD